MKKYIINGDVAKMYDYQKKNKDKILFKYHLNVLPHPYFGDISSANVIFLAINPSYALYEDEYDTFMYEEYNKASNKNINLDDLNDKYFEFLKKVDFFDDFKNEYNKIFFNTWKWWNTKVIGDSVKPKKYVKVAFANYCPYHSKRYNNAKYNSFPSTENIIKTIKSNNNLKLIIFVWGSYLWKDKIDCDNTIILNKNINIDTLAKILDNKDDARYSYIKDYFKKGKR